MRRVPVWWKAGLGMEMRGSGYRNGSSDGRLNALGRIRGEGARLFAVDAGEIWGPFCGEEGMSVMGWRAEGWAGAWEVMACATGAITRFCVMDGRGWLEGIGGTMHASSP